MNPPQTVPTRRDGEFARQRAAGVSVSWITYLTRMSALGHFPHHAATALNRNEQQSRDSFTWYRGTDVDVQKHRDGLTLDDQGMSPLSSVWSRCCRQSRVLPVAMADLTCGGSWKQPMKRSF